MLEHTAQAELEAIISRASVTALRWSQQRSQLALDEKSAGQFASNADIEIEEQIRNELTRAFPGKAIIGEEMGGDLGTSMSGWAIDPIDGTSNFILGLPIWGISIGYVQAGRSVLGAIALPEQGLTLSAARGSGVRVNAELTKIAQRSPEVKLIALGENDFESGSKTDARAQAFRDQVFAVVRYRCAVFSLGVSALGKLNGYIENGCGLWDIAAAEIICREAGMQVETTRVAEGRYSIDARWRAGK